MGKSILYSIGKVSKICDVSQRMLRYYEEVGLITPDRIAEPSHYRYYSVETMRKVQTIRYLIEEGFRLEEIREVLPNEDLKHFQELFLEKIAGTEERIKYYHQRLDSLKAWYALLVEGQWVHRHKNNNINVKYIPKERYFYYDRACEPGEEDAEAYLETEYYTMSKRDGHSMVDMGGAFCVRYDGYRERMEDTYQHMTLLQILYPNSKSQDRTMEFGGFMALSCYHIGRRDRSVCREYELLLEFARQHAFTLRGDCYERHVLDVYSTAREENYVTELLLPVEEDVVDFQRLNRWQQEAGKGKTLT